MPLLDRNLSPTDKAIRRYLSFAVSLPQNGDEYTMQALDGGLELVWYQVRAGTVVGGTTVTVDFRKNGVSMLTTPTSLVGKQGVNVQGVIGTVTRIAQNDIIGIKIVNVGAGSFGQLYAVACVRPLVGREVPR